MLVENTCKICVFYFHAILSEAAIYFSASASAAVEGATGKVRYKHRCFCELMHGYIQLINKVVWFKGFPTITTRLVEITFTK